jgi:hypothetical protein
MIIILFIHMMVRLLYLIIYKGESMIEYLFIFVGTLVLCTALLVLDNGDS